MTISPVLKDNIQKSLDKIETGEFEYDNLCTLLIHLRDAIGNNKNNAPVFHDILDSVAHKNRDQGFIFNHSKNLINEFVSAIKLGGRAKNHPIDLNLEDSFQKIFKKLNIKYNQNLFNKQILKIKDLIYSNILDDSNLKIKNSDIQSCSIKKLADNNLYLAFKFAPFKAKINNMSISGEPTLQVILIS